VIVTIAGSAFTFLPNDTELGGINLEFAAFDGVIGSGQFPIPDPASSLTPVTGRQFRVDEGSALLTDGFMIDWDRLRGPFVVGTQREYPISVQDANALLGGFRVEVSRPSETDYARVIAMAGIFGSTLGVAWDTTWVLNASTVTMPAKKYSSDSGFGELIIDLVEFTGKTMFLHDKAAGGRCLHYHVLTSGHTCGLTITDATPQVSGGTAFNPQAPDHQRTSIDLRNDVKGRDQANRTSTASDSTSITAHDVDGLLHQALVDFEASSQADLNAKTAAYLAQSKGDYDTYTCSIGPLDGTALGLIRVGDLVTVTSGAMGLSASVQRIAHMRLKVADGKAPGLWTAELELGAPIRRRAHVKAPNPGIVGPPNPAPPAFEIVGTDTFANIERGWDVGTHSGKIQPSGPTSVTTVVTADTLAISGLSVAAGITAQRDPLDAFPTTEDFGRIYIQHVAPSGAGAGRLRGRIFAWSRACPVPTQNLHWEIRAGIWTVTAGGSTVVPRSVTPGHDPNFGDVNGVLANGSLVSNGLAATVMAAGTFVDIDIVIPIIDSKFEVTLGFDDAAQTTLNAEEYGGTTTSFVVNRFPNLVANRNAAEFLYLQQGTGTALISVPVTGYSIDWIPSATPVVGQWILNETPTPAPDGATSAFVTRYPYQPGSLRVRVDSIAQNVTETSPTAGTFALSWDPATGDAIRVDYLGTG
jgi:hypothetical protein